MVEKIGKAGVSVRAVGFLVLGCIGGLGALIIASYLRNGSLQTLSDHWFRVVLFWGLAAILPPFFLASWNAQGVAFPKAVWALISAGVVHPVFLIVFISPVAYIAHNALFAATVTIMISYNSERKVTDFVFGEAIGWSGYFCLAPVLMDFGPRSHDSAYLTEVFAYLYFLVSVVLSFIIAALVVYLMPPARCKTTAKGTQVGS